MSDFNITGKQKVGGLAGSITSGSTVANCYTKGTLTATNYPAGGLAGYVDNEVVLSDSYSDVILSNGNYGNSGGFIGEIGSIFQGNIDRCYSLGSVTGTGINLGGFIGYGNGNNGHITNCYSMTTVQGGDYAGGFYGYSYYLNTVNCYATGAVTGTNQPKGFVAYNDGNNVITNCFWDYQSTGQYNSDGGTGKNTTEMKTQSTFTGWDFTATTGIWEIETVTAFSYPYLRQNAQSPAPGHEVVNLTGLGTTLDPYQITNLEDLRFLSEHSIIWSSVFIQTDDIDATPTSGWNSNGTGGYYGFSPIGNYTDKFTGKYDGQNHIIENLFENSPPNYGGLFGNVDGSLIQNLGLTSINITGSTSYIGGLVGYLKTGTVENCYVTGTLTTSAGEAGGLVGYANSGTINNCYFNGSIGAVSDNDEYIGGLVGYLKNGSVTNCNAKGSVTTESSYTGGLIGYVKNSAQISDSYSDVVVSGGEEDYSAGFIGGMVSFDGSIDQCYSLGSVTGTGQYLGGFIGEGYGDYGYITNCYSLTNVNGGDNAGGFYGYSYYLITENCYAAGAVTGTSGLTGGFAGYDYGGNTITNSFWDVQTSGQLTSDGDLGTPKSTAEMKTQATFVDWDFATTPVWKIDANNSGYPYLAWQTFTSDAPTITSFTPTTAGTGTTVTVAGTNFTGATAVSFGGTAAASFTVVDATTITAVVASGTSGSVSVTTPGGTVSLGGFTFIDAPSAQPTNLNFSNTKTGSNFNIVVNYTASASAEGYLVARKTGSAPTFVPVNGTTYAAGAQGSDQVVYAGSALTCTDATVTAGAAYYYAVYAYKGSGSSITYRTTSPLSGNSTLYNTSPGAVASSASTAVSAGFPNAGVNVTFPGGTTGTMLTVTKTTAAPASNFSVLPGVRGVKSLYFTITSSNATPGNYTLVMDFSSLGLTSGQWANFKVLKRANVSSEWVDVTTIGGTIVSRQTDGVWGKFTISGLTSFSEFALGESFDGAIVNNLNQDIIAAMGGNTVNFNAQAFTTNGTNYDLTWVTLSIWNADDPANAVLKLYAALTTALNEGEIDIAGGPLVTFGAPTLGDLVGDNYNARFYPSSPGSYTLQANTTYWLVFSSSSTSDFNTTLSSGYSGVGTLPANINNAQSDDSGLSYTYYPDQPFLVAVNGNIIPTVITWDGSTGADWNTAANWDLNSIPITDNLVVIPGTGSGVTSWPVVNEAPATPAVCYDLTINAGGILSVNPGKALTVNGTLTNSEGATGLSIESDLANGSGSLLHHTANIPAWFSVTIPGAAELTDFKYHLVSVPLTPASNSTSIIFEGLYLYYFDVANDAWNSLGTSTTTALDETKGYMVYRQGADVNLFFEDNMNAGDFTANVVNAGSGYNLVPNPYPSSIDWNAASGWTKTNIANATWIWNSNAVEHHPETTVGNYAAYVNGTGTNGGSRYIAPGQAFFVKTNAASPVLAMNDNVRLHNATPFLKSGENIADLLRVNATANNYSDEVVIRFAVDATPAADAAFDAEKMYGLDDAPQLYTFTPYLEKLSINSLPFATDATEVPMSFELAANTSCTLTFSEMESFEPETNIFLEDLLTGSKINLRQQTVYTFEHLNTNNSDRFKLWFGNVTAIPEITNHTSKMWIAGNTVYINAPELNGQQAQVEVYNPAGQRLLSKSIVLNDHTTLQLNLKGFVIVKLTSGKQVLTTKGILMK